MRIYSFITSERTQNTQGANKELRTRVLVGDKVQNRQIADIQITHEKLGGTDRTYTLDQYTLRLDGEIVKQFRRDRKTGAWTD